MPVEQRCFTSKYKGISNVLMNKVGVARAFAPPEPSPTLIPKNFHAIWDTGATNTVITQKVVQECDLRTTGMTWTHHAQGVTLANTYLVSIFLPNKVVFGQIRATEGILPQQADVLIGMDIIARGDFAVTNYDGKTVFSFRMPSVEQIDFVEQLRKRRPARVPPKVGRNAPCPCGSGKKYKNCCLKK